MKNEQEVVSKDVWLQKRRALLKKEKEFTRLRDELSQARRDLPWVEVDKPYAFSDGGETMTLAELFGEKSQLVVYHFMYGPDWEEPCRSCSFWADNFNGIDVHLAHRDISFLAVSSAPADKLAALKQRMGWSFRWFSSAGSDFNRDYHVSFSEEQKNAGDVIYNYKQQPYLSDEMPGVSVFYKDDTGQTFHTYSTYSRGLDILNGAYNFMDLSPKGRDESDGIMRWLKLHDEYS